MRQRPTALQHLSRLRILLSALLAVCFMATTSMAPGQTTTLRGQQAIVSHGGWIKIRLKQGERSCSVRVTGNVKIVGSQGPLSESATGGVIQVTAGADGMQATLNGTPVGGKSSVLAIEPAQVASTGWFEAVGLGRYRGRLILLAKGSNFDLINQIQIDDWLKGVLPAEIGSSHMEALKAQAVAARSEAVHKLYKPPHASEGFDFCPYQHCQVYKGMAAEESDSNQACDATEGQVLMAGDDVMDAVYHDVCGGITAGAEDVWQSPPRPGLKSIYDVPGSAKTLELSDEEGVRLLLRSASSDVFCNPARPGYPEYARKYYRWEKTLDATALEKIAGVGRIRDVAVVERCRSGRVRKLQISGDRGSRVLEKELPIRQALDLWSGLFVVSVDKTGDYLRSATFQGAGHGHGAGLCQMGARSMALAGNSYDQILAHYYVGSRLVRIYRR